MIIKINSQIKYFNSFTSYMKRALFLFFISLLHTKANIFIKDMYIYDTQIHPELHIVKNGTAPSESGTNALLYQCEPSVSDFIIGAFTSFIKKPAAKYTGASCIGVEEKNNVKGYNSACWVMNYRKTKHEYITICQATIDTFLGVGERCHEIELGKSKDSQNGFGQETFHATSESFSYTNTGYMGNNKGEADENQVHASGYVFEDIEDASQCEVIANKQYLTSGCPDKRLCRCSYTLPESQRKGSYDCGSSIAMPDIASETWKSLPQSVKQCFSCHYNQRKVKELCELSIKSRKATVRQKVAYFKNKGILYKRYGVGSYACGYLEDHARDNTIRCGCVKKPLPRPFRPLPLVAQKQVINAEFSSYQNAPVSNLFSMLPSVRDFLNEDVTMFEGSNCKIERKKEIGEIARGDFLRPKSIISFGASETIMQFGDFSISDPYYDIDQAYRNSTDPNQVLFVSQWHPRTQTIKYTYYNDRCELLEKPEFGEYEIAIRMEHNARLNKTFLVAYVIKNTSTQISEVLDKNENIQKGLSTVNGRRVAIYRIGQTERPPLKYSFSSQSLLTPLTIKLIEDTANFSVQNYMIEFDPQQGLNDTGATAPYKEALVNVMNLTGVFDTIQTNGTSTVINVGKECTMIYGHRFCAKLDPCSVLASKQQDIEASCKSIISSSSSDKNSAIFKYCKMFQNLKTRCQAKILCTSQTDLETCKSDYSNIELKEPYEFYNSNTKFYNGACISEGLDFPDDFQAESSEMGKVYPNTYEFGNFGNPEQDYVIAIRDIRQGSVAVSQRPITYLGPKSKDESSYIISTPSGYFLKKNMTVVTRYLQSLPSSTNGVSVADLYFPNCKGDPVCINNRIVVRKRKLHEYPNYRWCTSEELIQENFKFTRYGPHDVYIPLRCHNLEFHVVGSGGSGATFQVTEESSDSWFRVQTMYNAAAVAQNGDPQKDPFQYSLYDTGLAEQHTDTCQVYGQHIKHSSGSAGGYANGILDFSNMSYDYLSIYVSEPPIKKIETTNDDNGERIYCRGYLDKSECDLGLAMILASSTPQQLLFFPCVGLNLLTFNFDGLGTIATDAVRAVTGSVATHGILLAATDDVISDRLEATGFTSRHNKYLTLTPYYNLSSNISFYQRSVQQFTGVFATQINAVEANLQNEQNKVENLRSEIPILKSQFTATENTISQKIIEIDQEIEQLRLSNDPDKLTKIQNLQNTKSSFQSQLRKDQESITAKENEMNNILTLTIPQLESQKQSLIQQASQQNTGFIVTNDNPNDGGISFIKNMHLQNDYFALAERGTDNLSGKLSRHTKSRWKKVRPMHSYTCPNPIGDGDIDLKVPKDFGFSCLFENIINGRVAGGGAYTKRFSSITNVPNEVTTGSLYVGQSGRLGACVSNVSIDSQDGMNCNRELRRADAAQAGYSGNINTSLLRNNVANPSDETNESRRSVINAFINPIDLQSQKWHSGINIKGAFNSIVGSGGAYNELNYGIGGPGLVQFAQTTVKPEIPSTSMTKVIDYSVNGKIDTECKTKCPRIYVKRRVYSYKEDKTIDAICEYGGDETQDGEAVLNGIYFPSKCFKSNGDVIVQKTATSINCPMARCKNMIEHLETSDKQTTLPLDQKKGARLFGACYNEKQGGVNSIFKNSYMVFEGMNTQQNKIFNMFDCVQLPDEHTEYSPTLQRNVLNTLTCRQGGFWEFPEFKEDAKQKRENILASLNSTIAQYSSELKNTILKNLTDRMSMSITIKQPNYPLLQIGFSGSYLKQRSEFKFMCPALKHFNRNPLFTGHANWEESKEMQTQNGTCMHEIDRDNYDDKNIYIPSSSGSPKRMCKHNGIWGIIENPCGKRCPNEIDNQKGIKWDAPAILSYNHNSPTASVTGVCTSSVGMALNKSTSLRTRVCNLRTGEWEDYGYIGCVACPVTNTNLKKLDSAKIHPNVPDLILELKEEDGVQYLDTNMEIFLNDNEMKIVHSLSLNSSFNNAEIDVFSKNFAQILSNPRYNNAFASQRIIPNQPQTVNTGQGKYQIIVNVPLEECHEDCDCEIANYNRIKEISDNAVLSYKISEHCQSDDRIQRSSNPKDFIIPFDAKSLLSQYNIMIHDIQNDKNYSTDIVKFREATDQSTAEVLDCNHKLLGFIKNNTIKNGILFNPSASYSVYALSAFCFNGSIQEISYIKLDNVMTWTSIVDLKTCNVFSRSTANEMFKLAREYMSKYDNNKNATVNTLLQDYEKRTWFYQGSFTEADFSSLNNNDPYCKGTTCRTNLATENANKCIDNTGILQYINTCSY